MLRIKANCNYRTSSSPSILCFPHYQIVTLGVEVCLVEICGTSWQHVLKIFRQENGVCVCTCMSDSDPSERVLDL